jgi:diacylglycerol O-acyltransferase / wax synthase
MSTNTMSPLDASFLHIEDDRSHMHIGSVAIFEGPAPSYESVRSMVESKLPLVPRYRQKVRFVPLGLGRPVWVDDPHFNLIYHLRQTALPTPGGNEELRNLVGRVMSQQLDRSKPLWEMWVVEGLDAGRWALLSKVHHCMVDGVSGTDLLAVMLDQSRDAEPPARSETWHPRPEPTSAQILGDAMIERALSPYEMLRSARAATRAPRQLASQFYETARGLTSMRGLLRSSQTSLNGPIGPHRRWVWARSQLADVKAVRAALGGTVNDVVLAVITNGFRELMQSRGERVTDETVRTMVPVSVRSPGERGTYNNRVSAMFAELPVGIADPVERLNSIRTQMEGLKESKQAVAGEVLTSLTGFAPPMLLSVGTRAFMRLPQRSLNTVTTNVPGPQFPLYAAGKRMLEAFPYVPLAGTVRIGIAIFSYDGTLNFGVTGDYDSATDIGVLAGGIESGLAELVRIAEKAGGAKKAAGQGKRDRSAKPAAPKATKSGRAAGSGNGRRSTSPAGEPSR